MKIDVCPITGSKDVVKFLDLGMIPIEGNLTDTKEESINAKRYPMVLQYCPESKLATLEEYVNPDEIYENYLYHSSISKPYLEHCSKMYDYLEKYITICSRDTIVDIGGNDGSLLTEFNKKMPPHSRDTLQMINVECSKSFADINKKAGIWYFNEYFGENTDLSFARRKPVLITSTNVFQHTEPMRSFVKGITKNLANDGVWCLEFPYFLSALITDNYDQAYHEHVYYYFLTPLKQLFEQEGLKIINVSFHDIHTGTLRIISALKDSELEPDNTVNSFLNFEKVIDKDYLVNWGNLIEMKIEKFKIYLEVLKRSGAKIVGFGAAIKGCVFLNTCNLDYKTIDYIIDDTPEKQGKFVPGTGIEVFSREILKGNPPNYILILAHNFSDYIIKSLKESGYKGKFLVMFPNIQVIE